MKESTGQSGETTPARWRHWPMRILAAYLVLSPLVFFAYSTEPFVYAKAALLWATAIGLVSTSLYGLVTHTGATWSVSLRETLHGLHRDPIALGVVAMLASAILSTTISISPRLSLRGDPDSYAGLTSLASLGVLFFCSRALCRHAAFRCVVLCGALAGAAMAMIYALIQLAGLDPIPWHRQSTIGMWVRVAGTLGHANHLGAYLAVSTPLLLVLIRQAWGHRRRFTSGCLALLLLGLAVVTISTFSRAAWAALIAAVVIIGVGWWLIGARRAAMGLLLAGIIVGIAGTTALLVSDRDRSLVETLSQRAASIRGVLDNPRGDLWSAALTMLRERPLAGYGVDTYKLVFPRVQPVTYWQREWGRYPTRPHNELLHVAATQGLLGTAATLWLLAGIVVAIRRVLKRPADAAVAPKRSETSHLLVGLTASFGAYAAHAALGFSLTPISSLLSVLLGMASALSCPAAGDHDDGGWTRRERLATAASIAIAGILGVVCIAANAWLVAGALRIDRLVLVVATLTVTALLLSLFADRGLRDVVIALDWRADTANRRTMPRVIVQAGIIAAALGALYFGLYRPFTADMACRAGTLSIRGDRPLQAIVSLTRALHLAPGRDDCWHIMANAESAAARVAPTVSERLEAFSRARHSLEVARNYEPENPFHRAELARVQAAIAETAGNAIGDDEVREAFEEALARAPHDVLLRVDAGTRAWQAGELSLAQRYGDSALEDFAEFGPALTLLARVSMARGDWTRAQTELHGALRARWVPNVSRARAWSALALVYLQENQPDSAIEAANQALQVEPDRIEALGALARAHELMFDIEPKSGSQAEAHRLEAVQSYRHILQLEPDNAEALEALRRHPEG